MNQEYHFQPILDASRRKCFCFMNDSGIKLTLAGKTDFRSRDHFAECFKMHKNNTLDFADLESKIPFGWFDQGNVRLLQREPEVSSNKHKK